MDIKKYMRFKDDNYDLMNQLADLKFKYQVRFFINMYFQSLQFEYDQYVTKFDELTDKFNK